MNNFSPQKILKSIGLASLLSIADPVVRELGPQLSQNASITLPHGEGFISAIDRWQLHWNAPEVTVNVKVATENDVQETVCFNKKSLFEMLANNLDPIRK